MKKESKLLISGKITLLFIIMIVVTVVSVGTFGYIMLRNNAIHYSTDEAMVMADSISLAIDGDKFDEIMTTKEKNESWYEFKTYVDKMKKHTEVRYIYVLDNDYDENVTYFAEGYDPETNFEDEFDLGDTEEANVHADEVFAAISAGESMVTDPYDAGEFGYLVTGISVVQDSNGKVVGVVGVDMDVKSAVSSVNENISFFILMLVILLFVLVAFMYLFGYIIRRVVKKPIAKLTTAAKELSLGQTDIELDIESGDEIGTLSMAFKEMANETKSQADTLNKLAEGDLTVSVVSRSEYDTMARSIKKLTSDLSLSFRDILVSAEKVSNESISIADSANSLASASDSQSDNILTLVNTAEIISEDAQENMKKADRSAEVSRLVMELAEKGNTQMAQMIQAVNDIEEAISSINKVIEIIDSISFQTRILAINASIEAARAGEHGKGFDYVAGEVKSLATNAAESAKDTAQLIANSTAKVKLGIEIANETAQSLKEIVEGVNESAEIAKDIAKSSEDQNSSILMINNMIEEIADIVTKNAELSKESASASDEMAQMSLELERIIERFKFN